MSMFRSGCRGSNPRTVGYHVPVPSRTSTVKEESGSDERRLRRPGCESRRVLGGSFGPLGQKKGGAKKNSDCKDKRRSGRGLTRDGKGRGHQNESTSSGEGAPYERGGRVGGCYGRG